MIAAAIRRDSLLEGNWSYVPEVFVPQCLVEKLQRRLIKHEAGWGASDEAMPRPRVIEMESVLPWKYRSWNGTSYDDDAILKKADGAADDGRLVE
jgi:hypothetical protein